LFNQILPD